MAAFNWIVASIRCPACGATSDARCQTHVASSYSGDHRGRFHDREYAVGEAMNWWPTDHPDWGAWRYGGRLGVEEANHDEEACLATCPSCGAEIFVVVRFHGPKPEGLLEVGTESQWPHGSKR
jgi:predicted RNA-binding Zn-ribbon protein involved in translation (DUF1610 family)